ncbi:MAG: NADH-quinone oxidoreductase subunit L [Deltaproteobacteria bacterium]|nr:NADH-quinone oxidoreductase subunit L [Deltaproteobacteria bacterium]
MDFSGLKFAGLPLLAWVPLLPLLGALINLTLGRRLSRQTVHTIAIASVAAACGLSLYLVFGPLFKAFKAGQGGIGIVQNVYTWIEVGSLKIELAFTLDTLSAVMVLIITFVGTLIHIYSTGYMAHDPRYAAFFGYLNLFMGSMLVLVLGSSMPVMFIGWEGVGLCSFLLIGFWYEREDYATAGRKAFVVNRIGDFCFLLGMFLLFWAAKTVDFQALENPALGGAYVQPFWGNERLAAAAGILLFIGACGKSAQLPLFVWLPDAMAGPTPVSALIHAATMVTAGVYMVCRLSFLYSASTTALIVVATVGLLTALAAAFMAFAQTDLKKVLAYSTVSQLGFMFVAAGTGNWTAAIFHLGTHAFFKACLFLGAGSVMHGMEHGGSLTPGDITTMGGLRKHMPITRVTFMISCLAIAGIFPFAGFFSKDEILGGAFNNMPPGWPVWYGKLLWGGLLVAALGTAFYMWRLYFLVFSGDERSPEAKKAHESPSTMTMPLVILAAFATIIGFIGLPHFSEKIASKLPSFTHALSSWLAPSVSPSWINPGATPGVMATSPIVPHVADSTTFALMAIALAIGVLGIGLAWMFYGKGPTPTVQRLTSGPLAGAYEASRAKLWFDEIYDVTIVRPFRTVARGMFEIADRFVIDTIAVNGSAFTVGIFGRVSRWFQNGQVQRYLAGLVLGAAAVFFVSDCRRAPTFAYEFDGSDVVLRAQPGSGLLNKASKVSWDLDDDGLPDPDPNNPAALLDDPELRVRAGDIPGSRVTLFIDDPITRKRVAVTRHLEQPAVPVVPGSVQP